MHWHTETTADQLASPPVFIVDRTASDDPAEQPDTGAVDAAYAAAQSLVDAIGAGDNALITIDRNKDSETSAQTISVTVTVA